MKRLIAVGLVFVVIIGFLGCSDSSEQQKEIEQLQSELAELKRNSPEETKVESNVVSTAQEQISEKKSITQTEDKKTIAEKKLDDHFMMSEAVFPDYETYKKPASENGKKDTTVKLRGEVGAIFDNENVMMINLTESGTKSNTYVVILGWSDNEKLRKIYEPLQNKEWYLGASYMGFSELQQLPAVTAWFVACDGKFYSDGFNDAIGQGVTAKGKDYLSRLEFDKIEIGMTLDEVEEIIGKPGELTAESESSTTYKWSGENGDGVALIHFSDGKVKTKSQSGLK